MAGWCCRPVGPSTCTSRAPTSSTPSTSRSSCSSATSSRAGSTASSSRSTRTMPGGTFHGQCAELCGVSHNAMHFDVHAHDRRRLRRLARGQASPKRTPAPPPPPSGEPAPSGEPRPSSDPARPPERRRSTPPTPDARRPTRRSRSTSTIRTPSIPHNVAIHEGSPTGPEVFKGEVFPGPAKKTYDVPAAAGRARMASSARSIPTMTGTLTVQ